MLDINYYLRGGVGLLQKSRLATTSLPFSSSYAYRIYQNDPRFFSYACLLKKRAGGGKGGGSGGEKII